MTTFRDTNTGLLMQVNAFGEFSPVPMLRYYVDPDTQLQVIRGVHVSEEQFDRTILKYDLIEQEAPML